MLPLGRLRVKDKDQKDTFYEGMGLCAQTRDGIQGSIVPHN